MKKWFLLVGILFFASMVWIVTSVIYPPAPQRSTDDKFRISGAKQSLDMLGHVRAYPNPNVDNAGLMPAFEASQQRFETAIATQTQPWLPIGPHNIGGRTLAIAINPQNPNTVYAGSASGGLWRSDSAGCGPDAWERVTTGFPVLGVSSIAIDPNNPNIIYIGTGEVYGSPESFPGVTGQRLTRGSYGIGVLKTVDGGLTWTKSLDWTYDQQRGVQDVRIDPLNSNIIWAATTEGTFKSIDDGATWFQVLNVVMATDIAINPTNPTNVFVASGGMGSPGHGVYRTQDGGATWQPMSLLGPNFTFEGKAKLAMSPSSPNVVYVGVGKSNGEIFPEEITGSWLFKTNNGGDSWFVASTVDFADIQGWYAHDLAVHPTNPSLLWVGGRSSSPYRSTDGGTTLAAVRDFGLFEPTPETVALDLPGSHADFHDIQFHPHNPQIIYFANDGGVFRTLDAGLTAEHCGRGYQTTQFYNGVTSSQTDPFLTLGGMQDNGTAAYEGSLEWRRLFGRDGSWTAINQNNNNIIFISAQYLNIQHSTDRGVTFNEVRPRIQAILTNFISPFILSPADNTTLYAGTNVVFKSTSNGLAWLVTNGGQPLSSDPLIALAGSYQNVNVVYAATSPGNDRGRLFKTTDGSQSWRDITQNLPDRFPTDIAVGWLSDLEVYVTFGGFGSSHVFKSLDGGNTWIDIGFGLPDCRRSVIADRIFPISSLSEMI